MKVLQLHSNYYVSDTVPGTLHLLIHLISAINPSGCYSLSSFIGGFQGHAWVMSEAGFKHKTARPSQFPAMLFH